MELLTYLSREAAFRYRVSMFLNCELCSLIFAAERDTKTTCRSTYPKDKQKYTIYTAFCGKLWKSYNSTAPMKTSDLIEQIL